MKPWRKLYASILDSDSLYGVSSEAFVLLMFLIVAQDDSGYYPWTPVKVKRLITSRPAWDQKLAEQYARELEAAGVLTFQEDGVMLAKGRELNGIIRKDVAEELYPRNHTVNATSTERTRDVIIDKDKDKEESKSETKKRDARAPKNTFVSEAFVTRMVQEYAEVWSEKQVQEIIAQALNHTAVKKALDVELYVQGWLRRDAEKVGSNERQSMAASREPSPFAKYG